MNRSTFVLASSALLGFVTTGVCAEPANSGDAAAQAKASAVDASQSDEVAAVLLTDFADSDRNALWQVVNDNVMGGRSIGNLSFQAEQDAPADVISGGTLTFEGSINTNGGGFASIRLPLSKDVLVGVRAIRMRVKADARPYGLRIEDGRPHGGRIINHRAPLNLDPDVSPDEWQMITLPLDAFSPSWRGNAVPSAAPLDTRFATRLGLMLNDTQDGPFKITVDRFELVR